jgi:hypothetical protein
MAGPKDYKVSCEENMADKFSWFFIILLTVSCATSKKQADIHPDTDAEQNLSVPSWVYSPEDQCNKARYLCASAQAESMDLADANAFSSLASIFETRIQSKFEMEKHDYSEQETSIVIEKIQEAVAQNVDQILKGAVIKKRAKFENMHYSLAALDKMKAAEILSREIKALDDQLAFLFNQGKKSSLLKMHSLYDHREMLNQKYIILTNSSLRSDFTFSRINTIKFQKPQSSKLKIKAMTDAPNSLIKWMNTLFNEMGYSVLDTDNVNYLIKIKFLEKPEYLKVAGFEKYTFVLQVEAKNSANEVIGSVVVEQAATGRNKQDAYSKIKDNLQEQFKRSVNKLNLD